MAKFERITAITPNITVSDNTAGTFGNLDWISPIEIQWQPYTARIQEENMRGLFEVFVVNPEDGYVSDPIRVIAKDEASARLKAVRELELAFDVDDYDIIVRRLGDVRPKRDVREVKVLKD